jgi:hypothetical protein
VPDLIRVGNERSKDEIPDEVTEPDDTGTAATRDGDVAEEESPA